MEKEPLVVLLGLFVLAIVVANLPQGKGYQVEDLEIGAQAEPTPTQIIAKLSRQMNPKGVPVVAKILDVDVLKVQAPVVYEGTANGQYLLQYPNLLVVYDYEADRIVKQLPVTNVDLNRPSGAQVPQVPQTGAVQGGQPGLPQDLLTRLSRHTGRAGNPVIAQIMDVEMLKQQQPAIYDGAANGQFVVQYQDLLVIYDYQADKIVKAFPIQNVNVNE